MNDWQQYPKGRKMKMHETHVVIVPEDHDFESVMPLFCEVCHFRFFSRDDETTYKVFKCCSSCADTWAYSNRTRWNEGWRPPADQVAEKVQKRLFANSRVQFE